VCDDPTVPGGPTPDATDLLSRRIDDWIGDARRCLGALYGDRAEATLAAVLQRVRAAAAERPADLASLDIAREAEPDWYQQPRRVGYVAYADRLGGDLAGVAARIPYLRELGIDVIHLMSVLKPREGENDGGYAVDDYRVPDPRLGSLDDLRRLLAALRDAGISPCLDLVMNHTSDRHDWAVQARAGSVYHRGLYRIFPDRTEPDAFEATLPEVFPDLSPGNFTWVDDVQGWVWTTFRDFQWDLDWTNPNVFAEIADVVVYLANLGVEILRLDAVAFTWKRLGTNSQNQPEAHLIAQALRAVLGMAAPASILLAEAIVGPDDLVAYLGRHEPERRECELAYHNQLMVQSWSMLAEGRAALATEALRRLPTPPRRSNWLTYVRCHDDIGWAVADQDAAAVGLDGHDHRDFLAAFYRGDFWQSFGRGVPFSSNPVARDERTSGMTAALCGITAALDAGEDAALATALDRHALLYGIAFGYGGIPIVYMGDELAQGDDLSYLDDPDRKADSRWRHRPAIDAAAAAQRRDPTTVPGRAWATITALVAARRTVTALHGAGVTTPLWSGRDPVFAWHRRYEAVDAVHDLLGIANVAAEPVEVDPRLFGILGDRPIHDVLSPRAPPDLVHLAPYQVRWLVPTIRPPAP
jgi:amylosucrase